MMHRGLHIGAAPQNLTTTAVHARTPGTSNASRRISRNCAPRLLATALAIVAGFLSLTACNRATSEYPLSTPQDEIVDKDLEGYWRSTEPGDPTLIESKYLREKKATATIRGWSFSDGTAQPVNQVYELTATQIADKHYLSASLVRPSQQDDFDLLRYRRDGNLLFVDDLRYKSAKAAVADGRARGTIDDHEVVLKVPTPKLRSLVEGGILAFERLWRLKKITKAEFEKSLERGRAQLETHSLLSVVSYPLLPAKHINTLHYKPARIVSHLKAMRDGLRERRYGDQSLESTRVRALQAVYRALDNISKIYDIDAIKPGNLDTITAGYSVVTDDDKDSTLSDLDDIGTLVLRGAAELAKLHHKDEFKKELAALRRLAVPLWKHASSLSGERELRPNSIELDLDEVWGSYSLWDSLALTNRSGRDLHGCTIYCELRGGTDETVSHIHHVSEWEADQTLHTRYFTNQEYMPSQTTKGTIKEIRLWVWSDGFTWKNVYAHRLEEKQADARRRLASPKFSIQYLPATTGFFGSPQGVKLAYDGAINRMPALQIHVTFSRGSQEQTLFWEYDRWSDGDELLSAKTMRSEKWTFRPARVKVRLYFEGLRFWHDAGSITVP